MTRTWTALLMTFAMLAAGCAGEEPEPSLSTPTDAADGGEGLDPDTATQAALADGEHVVHVSGRDAKGELVALDPVEWLDGDAADRAAAEDGLIEPGEHVPNDYHVRNPQVERLWFALDFAAEILLVDCDAGCEPSRRVDARQFLDGTPEPMGGAHAYFVATVRDGAVVRLEQRYVP